MDLLTIAKKIADRVEAESLKQNAPGATWRHSTGSQRRTHDLRIRAATPRAAARIYAGWASLRRGLTAR